MSSFDRRSAFAVLAAAPLAACNFHPVGRAGSPGRFPAGQFAIEVDGGREGFELEEQLVRRLGQSGAFPDYFLSVNLDMSERESAAPGSGGIDRFAVDGRAEFTIRETESGQNLFEDIVQASASWSSTAQIPSSLAARRDAEDRMLSQIAERIIVRMTITSESWIL